MMDFLSCSKNYGGIISAFLLGSLLSLLLAPLLGAHFGVEGALGGYCIGQCVILAVLVFFCVREFPYTGVWNREFLTYFRRFPFIFFTGLLYNAGLWIDKLMLWYTQGDVVFGNFRAYSTYDTPVFIAYLSIIPSLAYFLIQAETRFFLVHRRFFDSITREPLQVILGYKADLVGLLKKSLAALCIIQVISSGCGSIASGHIGGWFGLSAQSVSILRILFFAAGAQVMFLYVIIFLMYFDLSKVSMYLVLLFFALNLSLNLLSGLAGLGSILPLGTAYLCSVLLALSAGLAVLLYSVSDIEYAIFMRQEN